MDSISKLPNYKSLADHIYEALRTDIAQGRLVPGQRLAPTEIAARLGCSPMPVRDAIRRLAAEGFVTISPRKETAIASLSLEEMRELFAIRSILEGYAASQACPSLTKEDLRELNSLVEAMESRVRANDLRGWFRHNQQFHFRVFEHAKNSMLRGILTSLWDRTLRLPSKVLLDRRDFGSRRNSEHRDMLRALQSRNAETVERAWRNHIARSGEETLEFFTASAREQPHREPAGAKLKRHSGSRILTNRAGSPKKTGRT